MVNIFIIKIVKISIFFVVLRLLRVESHFGIKFLIVIAVPQKIPGNF